MIIFQQVSKSYGGQDVLRDASFQINPGERVGVVGPNGAGKTTLFEMIVGEISPDKGTITLPPKARVGYLHQQIDPLSSGTPLLDHVQKGVEDVQAIHDEIEMLERQLHVDLPEEAAPEAPFPPDAAPPESPAAADPAAAPPSLKRRAQILRRIGELQTRFEHLGGYEMKNRVEAALCGLGFTVESLHDPVSTFSGGWQMRVELARTLLGNPDILLLDEPSNYLDIPAVEWLQEYLLNFAGTLVLVSHDRFLLNTLTTVTIEVANGAAERYAGNYDAYARDREVRYAQRLSASRNQDRKREQLERFVERFRAKNTKAAQAQSVMKRIEKMEKIEVPRKIVTRGRIRLPAPPHCGREVMRLTDAGVTYDGRRWVLRHVDLGIERGDKCALVGLNGTGKTTLLRMLAGNLPLSEGKRVVGHKVSPGYQSQESAETMDASSTVFAVVKAMAPGATEQEVRTMLGGFGFSGDAVEKRVSVLSGGEKLRLAFARHLVRPPNFLILDEPTTHLDIQARETLQDALADYVGTVLLVSHDIEFVRHVATSIIAMAPPGIQRYPGGYDYYKEKTARETAKPEREHRAKTPDPARKSATAKDDKRVRAERLQAFSRKRRPLEKRVGEHEQAIEKLEAERGTLAAQLSAPGAGMDFAGVNQRLTQIQEEIARLTRDWEEAATELERLQWLFDHNYPPEPGW